MIGFSGADQTQFKINYVKGSQKIEKYPSEALIYLKDAKRKFNAKQDQFQDFVDMMIDISRAYRKLNNFEGAKSTLIECRQKIKAHPKCQDQQVKVYECKILSEYGGILSAQAQKFENKNINELKNNIDKSIDYYLKARNLAAATLVEYKNISNRQLIQSWQILYVSSIVSSIDPVLLQTQTTQNHLIYKLILNLAEKVSKYCSVFTDSESIKKLNSKSYYYQGSILQKISNQYALILKHLLFDYNFCLKKNQIQDAQKSRKELIKYYVCHCDHKQIKNLIKNDKYQNEAYNEGVLRVQRQLKQLQNKIKMENKMNTDAQIKQIKQYMKILQESNNQWFAKFIPIGKQILQKVNRRQLKALISFEVARCYFQTFDQLNAIHYCKLCLQQCQQDLSMKYECLYLLFQIYETYQDQRKRSQTQNQLRALIKKFPIKEKQLNQNLAYHNQNVKRYKLLISFFKDTQIQKTLFDEYQRIKNRKHKHASDMSDSNIQDDNAPRMNFTRQINSSTNKPQSLKEKYEALCQKNKVVIRQHILQELSMLQKSQDFNLDFSIFHQIPGKELQIYLEICKTEEWDLRNVTLDLSFIQKFIQKVNQKSTKVLKVYNLSKSIKKQTFNNLMKALTDIYELHLQKLNKKYYLQTTQSQSFSLEIPNPYQLKILKLKNCNINDDSLLDLCKRFSQLTQLDIASNQISGLRIQPLNSLQNLQKLNLSYNPLQSIKNLENANIKKLKIKGLKKNIEDNQRLTQIKYCEILDISQNSNSIEKIIKMILNQFAQDQILGLSSIEEIRIKKCNLTQQACKEINVLLAFLTNIKRLDLRFCCVERKKIEHIIKYQNIMYSKKVEIDYRAIISQGYKQQK